MLQKFIWNTTSFDIICIPLAHEVKAWTAESGAVNGCEFRLVSRDFLPILVKDARLENLVKCCERIWWSGDIDDIYAASYIGIRKIGSYSTPSWKGEITSLENILQCHPMPLQDVWFDRLHPPWCLGDVEKISKGGRDCFQPLAKLIVLYTYTSPLSSLALRTSKLGEIQNDSNH